MSVSCHSQEPSIHKKALARGLSDRCFGAWVSVYLNRNSIAVAWAG